MKKTKVSTTTDVADIQQSPVAVALGAIYYSVGKTLIGAVSGESVMDYAVYGTIENGTMKLYMSVHPMTREL